jgi:serine/threonine protein kinase/GTPase SAR1 family protein
VGSQVAAAARRRDPALVVAENSIGGGGGGGARKRGGRKARIEAADHVAPVSNAQRIEDELAWRQLSGGGIEHRRSSELNVHGGAQKAEATLPLPRAGGLPLPRAAKAPIFLPLIGAAIAGDEAKAEHLLAAGADVDGVNENGTTALCRAARGGHEALVALLVDRGANADHRTTYGTTPLHEAAEAGHDAVFQQLVGAGADPTRRDAFGRTAQDVAQNSKSRQSMERALSQGERGEQRKAMLRELDGSAKATGLVRQRSVGWNQQGALLVGNSAGPVQQPKNAVLDKYGSPEVMKKISGNNKHTWKVFVRSASDSGAQHRAPLDMTIKSVRFDLHSDFTPPSVTKYKEPFEVQRTGWGMFEVGITITYHNGKVQELSHYLNFDKPMTAREVPFPRGVGLLRVDIKKDPEMVPKQPKDKRKQGEDRTPWGELERKRGLDRTVYEPGRQAVLCVASAHTRSSVRSVAEQMDMQYVGCDNMAEALSRLELSIQKKQTGLPVEGAEPEYVAVVAALGMAKSDVLFDKHNRSELLDATTAAGLVAVVYSHTACENPQHRKLSLDSGARAVVNTGEDLAAALAAAGVGAGDSDDAQLPDFIQSLGDLDQVEFYKELLSQGKRRLEYSKLMIVGPGRVGKTSMLRKLTGQSFDGSETSTRGVDACSVDVRTWQHSQRGDTSGEAQSTLSIYRDALALTLAEREIEKRAAADDSSSGSTPPDSSPGGRMRDHVTSTLSPNEAVGGGGDSVQQRGEEDGADLDKEELLAAQTLEAIAVVETQSQPLQRESTPSIETPSDAAVEIQSAWRGYVQRKLYREMRSELEDPQLRTAIMDKVRMLENERKGEGAAAANNAEEQRRIMTVLDFAGQRMYYIMHHILMSPRLSVYVVCMSLASNPDETTDGDEGSSLPMTVLENLHFWLNSIAAQAPKAPIVLVGTHSDAVTAEVQQAFIQRVESSFVDKFFERQLHGGIHPISSVTGDGIESLRAEIESVAESLPDYGKEIPLGWLKFIERAGDLVSKGVVRMSLSELRSHASACSVGEGKASMDQELNLLLGMLTDVGLLLWFSDLAVRDLVILKPQWLLDTMRELCDITMLTAKSQQSTSRDLAPEWRMLLHHGRIDATKLARYVWPDGNAEESNSILGLMQKFGLCCSLPQAELNSLYVVPVLLPSWTPAPSKFPDSLFQDDSAVVASVRAIHSDALDPSASPSFLPEAIFFNLQVALLSTLSATDVRASRHLYRERIIMLTDEGDYFVERVAREQQLRIVVRVESGREPPAVATQVMDILSGGIAARFGLEFQMSVPCSKCSAHIPVVDDHFGQKLKCPECRSNQADTVQKWRASSQQPAGGQQSRSTLADTDPETRPAEPGPTAKEARQMQMLQQQDWKAAPPNTDDVKAEFAGMMIPFEELKMVKPLGSGGFGAVYKMIWSQHSEVAVKVLHEDEGSSAAAADFMREMTHLKQLLHPNVIQMYGVTRGSFAVGGVGQPQWMMVSEFMKLGSLYDWVHRRSQDLSWLWKLKVMTEIAKAMSFLHSDLPAKAPLAHLDLKPMNVLLSKGPLVKVADFGLSRAGQHTTGHGNGNGNDTRGTVEYMGPEMYMGDGIGTATDVYAFGIMMWEVLMRKRPLLGFLAARGCEEHPQAMTLLPMWVAVDTTRPKLPSANDGPGDAQYCPAEWIDLMESCWKAKPRERPRFPAVLAALHRMQAAAPPPQQRQPQRQPQPQPQPEPEPEPEPEVVQEKQRPHSEPSPTPKSEPEPEPVARSEPQLKLSRGISNTPGRWDCFISYTQRNSVSEAIAAHLYGELISRGLSVWLDIKMARRDEQAMQEGVQSSRCVIAIVSGAVDDHSEDTAYFRRDFCLKELRWALEADVVIQPVVAAEDKGQITEFFSLIPADLQHLTGVNWEHVDRKDSDYFQLGVTKILASCGLVESAPRTRESTSSSGSSGNSSSSSSSSSSGGGGSSTALAALLWPPSRWGSLLPLLWLRLRFWFQAVLALRRRR